MGGRRRLNKAVFKGEIIQRGDAAYEAARQRAVWNGRKPNRFPALIVNPTDEDDVVEAVRYAKAHGLKIGVRAGGHSWAGWCVRDDAMLLDLSGLRKMSLDATTGIVSVSPAIKGGVELDPYLEQHGLMFCGGHCPTVGLGGFLLQGGMGWNCRGWGWAAESIVAIDVVTADGELVRADATHHRDLFWAARGSGPGFFGVVTRFHLQTRPRPKAFTQSSYIYPIEYCDDILRWIHATQSALDTRIELVVLSIVPPLPPELNLTHSPMMVIHALAFVDTHEEGEEILRPLDDCPVLDRAVVRVFAQPTGLAEERTEQIRANPEGMRFAVDNAWVTGDVNAIVPALHDAFVMLPTAQTFTLWFSMAPLRELPDMALSLQTEIYLALYVVWESEADDARCHAWLAERMRRIESISIGQYLGDSDFAARPAKFVSDANWVRLQRIREKYDPTAMFSGYLGKSAHEGD
ncbi:MAG: FAD-binding oxidoreductase [Anaerolineae bacterium]|nr:FAD-binding oxidoreductase [Anaerolineae bacterium]